MKSLRYIIMSVAVAGVGLGLASCSDYLNEEKHFRDMQTEERIFESKNYSEQWLAYCYTMLLGDNMEIAHRRTCITLFSDDRTFNEGGNGEHYRSWKLGNYQEISSSNSFGYQRTWSNSYAGIRQASILIDNIHKNKELSEREIVDMKGQARFIRAYLYYLLFRKYGPVPVLPVEGLDYTKSYDELSLPRNTAEEVVDFVDKEMLLAAKELEADRSSVEIARPTKGAALATRAKILMLAASPLFNGNPEMSDFVDDKGNMLIPQTYDEAKWAKAAAALRDVIELGKYELNISMKKLQGDKAYPATVVPPYNAEYSDKTWEEGGWADIDPFESYRSIFNGDINAYENKELIFTRGVNDLDENLDGQETLTRHQMPNTFDGYNCHGMTLKQCDAYEMADGTPFVRDAVTDAESGEIITPIPEISKGIYGKFTSAFNAKSHPYDHVMNNVWWEYCNREPRFYASVSFNGCVWNATSINTDSYKNIQIWYYRGKGDGRANGTERWNPTGIGVMKFVNPMDACNMGGSQAKKYEVAIRYADILLLYAEALNELTASYEIPSWDGATTYTINRDVAQMHRGVRPVRVRAGVPDYSDDVYSDPSAFRKAIKHERQVELFSENQRYYDLRRWKDAPKEEGEQIYGCNVYMDESHKKEFHTPVRVAYLQSNFARRQYFWPISYDELKKNKRLTQSPGWQSYD